MCKTISVCVALIVSMADFHASVIFAQPSAATREQCAEWIEQLANKSEWPVKESFTLDEPRMNRKHMEEVKQAYDKLAKNFEVALPALVAAAEDKRYSHYQEEPGNGAYTSRTVGYACRDLIRRHVEIYGDRLKFLDGTSVPRSIYFLEAQGGVKKWYADRKEDSLLEMQLEALAWAEEQPVPSQLRNQRAAWQKAQFALVEFRQKLKKTGEPHRPKVELQFVGK